MIIAGSQLAAASMRLRRVKLFRLLAALLAIGATLWGIFVAVFILIGPIWWLAYFRFGSGYIVTIGYYWRALGRPSPISRRLIWGVSLLVQGAWLAFATIAAITQGIAAVGVAVMLWWCLATIISLGGLLFDRGYGDR